MLPWQDLDFELNAAIWRRESAAAAAWTTRRDLNATRKALLREAPRIGGRAICPIFEQGMVGVPHAVISVGNFADCQIRVAAIVLYDGEAMGHAGAG